MSLRPVISIAVLCVAHVAIADRAVDVDVDGNAPVTATDIADALRVRLGPTGTPIRVHVATVMGGVVVSTAGATRVIALAGLAGPDAARLIALATIDLLDDMAPIAPPGLAIEKRPSFDAERIAFRASVLGTAAAWSDMLAGVTVDFELSRGRWLGAVDLGAATLVNGKLELREAIVRVAGGIRFGVVDLRAGATFVPIDVTNGMGDQTVLVGAGASLRTRIAMSDAAQFVIAAGLDVFATQTDYTIGSAMVSTPWVSPWVAAGFEVTP